MTDDFDKLLAECPPTEADRAWAKAVLHRAPRSPMAREIGRTQFRCQFSIAWDRVMSLRPRLCKRRKPSRVWRLARPHPQR